MPWPAVGVRAEICTSSGNSGARGGLGDSPALRSWECVRTGCTFRCWGSSSCQQHEGIQPHFK